MQLDLFNSKTVSIYTCGCVHPYCVQFNFNGFPSLNVQCQRLCGTCVLKTPSNGVNIFILLLIKFVTFVREHFSH